MSSVSSLEEANVEDLNDLDNLINGDEVEEANENQEQPIETIEEGNPDDEAEEASAGIQSKPKRVIKNPQPKLNADTLKGPRGIQTLPQIFEKVKFKGKGYEEQDLNLLMKTYEYWCHRLFPKFSFDDCLARIEKLGSKKVVQTHVKKIRMDLLMDDEITHLPSDDEADAADEFDKEMADHLDEPIQLTEEQMERIRLNKEKALKKLRDPKSSAIDILPNSQITEKSSHEGTSSFQNLSAGFVDSQNYELSADELLERIRLNKEKALKKLRDSRYNTVNVLPNSQVNPCGNNEESNKNLRGATFLDSHYEVNLTPQMETGESQENEESSVIKDNSENTLENELEAEENPINTIEANENVISPRKNVNIDSESETGINDQDEEMDIESMLDIIADKP